jgi:Holliday junction resolvasome RuvABC endonuclease subunit
MPVEIRELIIRAEVQDQTVKPIGIDQVETSGKMNRKERLRMIEECVAQVLHIMEQKKER